MDRAYLDEKVKSLPHRPGVYIMKDKDGVIIYVGKAVSLRNRVSNYFGSLTGQAPKVRLMVSNIADFEYYVVDTEAEALNLENTLIKEHRPRYNILLRDDKTYPYIKVTVNEKWPRVFIVRKVLDDGARYFGPFAGNSTASRTIKSLDKLFPFRNCDLKITEKEPRPCLEYFIHRCLGPCAGLADKTAYDEAINQVIMFLEGKSDDVIIRLESQMEQAAEDLQFERAARLRDQLGAVRGVVEQQKVVSSSSFDEDVIALARSEGEASVQVFFIRRGKLIGRENFMLQGVEDETDRDVLTSFIKQYYSEATFIPPRLQVQFPIKELKTITRWLSRKAGMDVEVNVPKEGERYDLVQMVAQNAQESLEQNRLRWLNDEQKTTKALLELQDFLKLSELPRRIECYDISNTMGTNNVASMVVFENGSPKKSDYRRFKIKGFEGANDFGSLQEVIRRRFKRARTVEEADLNAREDVEENIEEAALELEAAGFGEGLEVQDPHDQQWGVRGHPGMGAEPSNGARKGKRPKPELNVKKKVDYSWQSMPDLLIIDGGQPQLRAVSEVLNELDLGDIPLFGMTKGPGRSHDEIVKPFQDLPLYVPRTSEAFYLVQRLRDEAHRFAITFHRQLRSKGTFASPLDSVPGIGPKRKQALIKNFGTAAKIKAAKDEDLLRVPGMTKAAIGKLREYL
ncbi:MAG: excinuclease subunit [Chloroflexi bacterium]|jgi:excinuclease ABC subunit C|nr:excinuclease subunit [Chloroflexota bacterium]